MALANPYQQYQYQQVNTAPSDKLLLMVFDGGIRFANQAKQAITDRRMDEAHYNLIKTQDIIKELMNTLNMDYDIAKNLYSLYDYFYRRLVEANVKKDSAIIDEVVGFLKDLRQTFAEAALKAKIERGPAVGGANIEG